MAGAAQRSVPTNSDLLRTQVTTTGIHQSVLSHNGTRFCFHDLGGERSERKKWFHVLEGVSAIIWPIDTTGYGRGLREDENGDRMKEQFMVFEYYANFYSFARSHFIIVFTKIDLLEEYMKEEDVNVFLRDAGILMDDEERVTTATEYMNILQRYLLGLMTSADARERMRQQRASSQAHPVSEISLPDFLAMSTSGDESRDVVEATNGGAAKGNATALEDKVRTPDKDGIINPKYDIGVIMFGTDADELLRGPNGEEYPSKEDLNTLRRVKGRISPFIYTIAFIELCERFAYYGTTAVFVNFIQQPLPAGSTTGAAGTYGQPGALDKGQQASTGLVTFNTFWAYLMPLVGGYLSDTYWGKYKTIHVAIIVALFGHIILIISALPPVIKNPDAALGIFSLGLIFFGIGVGFFKANISPMIAEQYEATHPRPVVETLKSGERVIKDPVLTISIIYMRYYFFINVGSLVGSISMVYAEKYVGFYLSFVLPTVLFLFCPFVLLTFKK
ncbi:G-protein alpha subunit-domain-containing protein [Nemania serpens]|nr:G-protein alpha subunit-domain-containing protein [Nemania serpens]